MRRFGAGLRRRTLVMLGVLVLSALAGGIAWAAIPDEGGVINACYQKANGILRVVDNPDACRGGEVSLSWNQEGPAGPPGTSEAYTSFQSERVWVPREPGALLEVMSWLDLPAHDGAWILTGKAHFDSDDPDATAEIYCELAGDPYRVDVGPEGRQSLPFSAIIETAADDGPFIVEFSCANGPGESGWEGNVGVEWIRITAIPVDQVWWTDIPAPSVASRK